MCKTRFLGWHLHRLQFGHPGDWQFRLQCGKTAYGPYMRLGILSIAYLRPLTCKLLGHVPGTYSLLEAYRDLVAVCARCQRTVPEHADTR